MGINVFDWSKPESLSAEQQDYLPVRQALLDELMEPLVRVGFICKEEEHLSDEHDLFVDVNAVDLLTVYDRPQNSKIPNQRWVCRHPLEEVLFRTNRTTDEDLREELRNGPSWVANLRCPNARPRWVDVAFGPSQPAVAARTIQVVRMYAPYDGFVTVKRFFQFLVLYIARQPGDEPEILCQITAKDGKNLKSVGNTGRSDMNDYADATSNFFVKEKELVFQAKSPVYIQIPVKNEDGRFVEDTVHHEWAIKEQDHDTILPYYDVLVKEADKLMDLGYDAPDFQFYWKLPLSRLEKPGYGEFVTHGDAMRILQQEPVYLFPYPGTAGSLVLEIKYKKKRQTIVTTSGANWHLPITCNLTLKAGDTVPELTQPVGTWDSAIGELPELLLQDAQAIADAYCLQSANRIDEDIFVDANRANRESVLLKSDNAPITYIRMDAEQAYDENLNMLVFPTIPISGTVAKMGNFAVSAVHKKHLMRSAPKTEETEYSRAE